MTSHRYTFRHRVIYFFTGSCIVILFYSGNLSWITDDSKQVVVGNGEASTHTPRKEVVQLSEQGSDLRFSNKDELKKLGEIVRRRLKYIQNPKSCESRRKLRCIVHALCGFGCQVNTISSCLMIAYALNRTVVETPQFTSYFEPISTSCRNITEANTTVYGDGHEEYQVVEYELARNMYTPEFHPPALPEDLVERIRRYHDYPFLWWTSQVSSFVFRPTTSTYRSLVQDEYMEYFQQPIVGLHVRRTDKLARDARLYSLDEYMVHVDSWFKTRPDLQRRLFLATDEPTVLLDMAERYPDYKVISNISFSIAAGGSRVDDLGKLGIMHDIYLLSKCDYVVCTLSSNVTRKKFRLSLQRRNETVVTQSKRFLGSGKCEYRHSEKIISILFVQSFVC